MRERIHCLVIKEHVVVEASLDYPIGNMNITSPITLKIGGINMSWNRSLIQTPPLPHEPTPVLRVVGVARCTK